MDIQSAELNELFVLYPVIIPGWVSSVKPAGLAHGGIPKAIYDGQSQGLECWIDPLFGLTSWTMAVDDRVDLYVNDDPTSVAGKTVAPGEEEQRIRLYLPHGRLNHGVNRLYYIVTRPSGNSETSRDLTVLYHLRLPDSLDLVIPPDVLKEGVDAIRAALGVVFGFIYNNRRPFDRIEFWLGDTTIRFDVPDAPAPVSRTLFTDAFEKADDNPSAVAEFYVIDQLGNRSKSPEKRLDIHLKRFDRPAPTVQGMTGNNFSPSLPEIRVLVPRGALRDNDQLSVTWKGATNAPAGSYTSPLRLVSAGLEIAVPRSVLAYSLGKPVTVWYSVLREGQTYLSLILTLNILPLPATALIPPKIVEADANNFLDVTKLNMQNATLHGLLWTLIATGQQVWLTLEGKKADGTAHNLPVWNGGTSKVNDTWLSQGYWPKALLISFLKVLGHGTLLTLKFKVAMDQSNVLANAVVFPDRVYTIRAAALVAPTLVSVKGLPSGVEVLNNGFTTETEFVFSGKASAGQKIELRDKGVVKATVTVPATGDWTHTLAGQAQGDHRYTVKALYGSGAESAARVVNVVAATSPTITSVKDASNWEIPDMGYTVHDSITVTGSAPRGQEVEVFVGTVPMGKARAGTNSIWTITLSSLALNVQHSIKAVGQYASMPPSNVRRLTSVQGQVPNITAMHDSKGGAIANGGTTSDTSVRLRGTANAFLEVEIFDGAISKDKVRADASGAWTLTVTGLTFVTHEFTAKAWYGSSTVSTVWKVTVEQLRIVDPSRLTLSGPNLVTRSTLLRLSGVDLPGTAANRPGTGGRPPYTYRSSNEAIASVDGSGRVRSQGNGTATITVRDSQGNTGSFEVACSGVEELVVGNHRSARGVTNFIAGQGGRRFPLALDPRMAKFTTDRPTLPHYKLLIGPDNSNGVCDCYQWVTTQRWVPYTTWDEGYQYHLGTIYLK
ncbi:Ig-like domain-containing protein [Pseudomonas sp. EA_5y_Pfl2_R50]|uniref:Ig-like domain-containing protein n=1 Tax=Pseudomonas sp. EA_5y_Pfl2_R50 TaxID=3088691 RepID=UPI0030D8BB32